MNDSNGENNQTICYLDWHPSVVDRVNGEYHIVKNGIISRRDYTLLFNSGDEKHHIPIQTTEQLNCYNEVTITGAVFRTLSQANIRLGIYDGVGNLLGYYIPEGFQKDVETLLAQSVEYRDEAKRLRIAKSMEKASLHNLRANLRYYQKHGRDLESAICAITEGIDAVGECNSVDEIMLVEARCRQAYYRSFNVILENSSFRFEKRSKMPPMDPINALLSFGNTVLYNKVQQDIWKTSLDSRIGILHAANRRHYSLNLDFADLFKPIIVDRVIFRLINRRQITEADFETRDDGSVYMNADGKRLFLQALEDKMLDRTTIKDESYTYKQLMEREIRLYLRHITEGTKYHPYKYY